MRVVGFIEGATRVLLIGLLVYANVGITIYFGWMVPNYHRLLTACSARTVDKVNFFILFYGQIPIAALTALNALGAILCSPCLWVHFSKQWR